jgi:hypothetical protein
VQSRAWLCVPPLVGFALDVTHTLLGQDECYWHGQYETALESNPLAHPFLACHPLAFLGGAIVCAALGTSLIYFWKHRLAVVIALLWTMGHAIGSASWLARHGPIGWIAAIVLIFLLERLFTFCLRRANEEPRTK